MAVLKYVKGGVEYPLTGGSWRLGTQDTAEHATLGEELAREDNWIGGEWSGSLAEGMTHEQGAGTGALSFTLEGDTAGRIFIVSFCSSEEMTTENLTVSIGGSQTFNLYGQENPISVGILAPGNGTVDIIPSADFGGTLTEISIREVLGSYTGLYPVTDSNGETSFALRAGKAVQHNLFLGDKAGQWNVSGYGNAALGSEALENNLSGFWNTAIGYKALEQNTAGSRNIGIGYVALYKNQVGQRNIAIGTHALREREEGNFNIAIGADAQLEGKKGDANIAIGTGALYHNDGGNRNIAIGYQAMTGSFTGANCGVDNIAIGNDAAPKLGEKSKNNILLGQNAGYNMVNAANNVVVGTNSGYGGNSGNVIVGNASGMNLNEWASANVLLGYGNGSKLNSGSYNILIGYGLPGEGGSWMYHMNIGDLLRGVLPGGTDPHLEVNGGLSLAQIPTADPGIAGRVWNDNGTLKISAGG